jgi:putative transcriptional regulator
MTPEAPVSEPLHHFPDDVLRSCAVGTASDGANLAVACHLTFCSTCRAETAAHETVLDALLRASAAALAPDRGGRDRLLADLPPAPPAPPPRPPAVLPRDMPQLPPPLVHRLTALGDAGWRRLIPGIRAIDLGITSAWRARLVCFRPGIPIPVHDHGGPEHTVVFSGGLDDDAGHLGPGDAATMMPGDAHSQRSSPGAPCVALIINEGPPRPLTILGRVLKAVTDS